MSKTATQIKTKAPAQPSTIEDMVVIFLGMKNKTTFIQLWQTTQTISRMRKTDNRFAGKIEKLNCLNCVVNYNYEQMINNAQIREAMKENDVELSREELSEIANFASSGLPFGEYVDGSKCIIDCVPKTGDWADKYGYYLQVAVLKSAKPVYRWIGGSDLTDDEVKEMKTFITPAKTPEGASQGLKKHYIIRSPRMETINEITMNHIHYTFKK